MKIKDIINELRMGHADLKSVNADDMLFGFESEIFLRLDPDSKETPHDIEKRFAEKMEKDVGFEFGRTSYGDLSKSKYEKDWTSGKWYMDYESSVKDIKDGEETDQGILAMEVTSSPTDYKQFLNYIEKLFDFYKNNNVETNETTGFHINISFKDKEKTKSIDNVKLMVFMGEKYIKDMFSRLKKTSDYNLASRIGPLIDRIQQDHETNNKKEDFWKSPEDIPTQNITKNLDEFIKILNTALLNQRNDQGHVGTRYGGFGNGGAKSFTVALHRLVDQGYVEFRLVGGKNYHQRFDEIKLVINRFIKILQVASDKEAYKNDYYKKLGNLMAASRIIEPKSTDTEIEILFKDNPTLLRTFYRIEHGYTSKSDPDFSHVEKTPDDIGWRMVEFIEHNLPKYTTELNKAGVKRALALLRRKYNVSNDILINIVKDKMRYDSFDKEKAKVICNYFGLPVPRVKKRQRSYNDYD